MLMPYRVLPGRSVFYQGRAYEEGELVDLATLRVAHIQSLVSRHYVEAVGADPSATSTPAPLSIPETRVAKVLPSPAPVPIPAATSVAARTVEEEREEGDTGFIEVEPGEPVDATDAAVEPAIEGIAIDINSADKDELMELISIGPKSALSIIENRPYTSFDEVPDKAELRGSAAGDWDQNRSMVVVGG